MKKPELQLRFFYLCSDAQLQQEREKWRFRRKKTTRQQSSTFSAMAKEQSINFYLQNAKSRPEAPENHPQALCTIERENQKDVSIFLFAAVWPKSAFSLWRSWNWAVLLLLLQRSLLDFAALRYRCNKFISGKDSFYTQLRSLIREIMNNNSKKKKNRLADYRWIGHLAVLMNEWNSHVLVKSCFMSVWNEMQEQWSQQKQMFWNNNRAISPSGRGAFVALW